MTRMLLNTIAVLCLTAGGLAAQEEVSQDAQDRIVAMLTEMRCDMDPDDIEKTDEGGYDLDDVICEGKGQFDIELDANFEEVGRRAE